MDAGEVDLKLGFTYLSLERLEEYLEGLTSTGDDTCGVPGWSFDDFKKVGILFRPIRTLMPGRHRNVYSSRIESDESLDNQTSMFTRSGLMGRVIAESGFTGLEKLDDGTIEETGRYERIKLNLRRPIFDESGRELVHPGVTEVEVSHRAYLSVDINTHNKLLLRPGKNFGFSDNNVPTPEFLSDKGRNEWSRIKKEYLKSLGKQAYGNSVEKIV